MKRKAILFAVVILGGCLPEQGKDLTACQVEAERFYQTYHAVDPEDPSSKYIISCMAAKGYDFIISPAECDSRHPLPTQPACYLPNGWVAGLINRFWRPLKSD